MAPEWPSMDDIDLYEIEASSFEADVNLLIRKTLHAALAHLSGAADTELVARHEHERTGDDRGHHQGRRGPRTAR